MLIKLLKSMGLAHAEEGTFYPRKLDVSDNRVSFAMPENFSRNFPAEDMRDTIDLDQPDVFSRFDSVLVLQRYWELHAQGLFGANRGTLQFTMHINRVGSGTKLDPASRESLVMAISHDLQKRYDDANRQKRDEDRIRYSNLEDDFVDFEYNHQRWVRYSIWKDDESELTTVYAAPIRDDAYVTVAFAVSPNAGTNMREFIDEYAQPFIDRIMHTFRIKYALAGNLAQGLDNAGNRKLEQQSLPE